MRSDYGGICGISCDLPRKSATMSTLLRRESSLRSARTASIRYIDANISRVGAREGHRYYIELCEVCFATDETSLHRSYRLLDYVRFI